MIEDNRKNLSELRQDIVSGEWVVIATGRAKRPNEFAYEEERVPESNHCPFETLEPGTKMVVTQDGEIVNSDFDSADWFVAAVPNKYPAFSPANYCPVSQEHGPYTFLEGVGVHEVIVFRPHDRAIAAMTDEEVRLIMKAYRDRYQKLSDEPCAEYVSLIHNHGPRSGASIAHPHSQIFAIPVIPPDVSRSLNGSARYFETHHTCVHCLMIEFESKEKSRVVFESERFLTVAPYASHSAFELRIFPKHHQNQFSNIDDRDVAGLAESLRVVLAKLAAGLKNPSYNFFLHTAPAKRSDAYDYYHWHLEILPKTAIRGGFEFGTGIEISTIMPEMAAEFLRNVAVN